MFLKWVTVYPTLSTLLQPHSVPPLPGLEKLPTDVFIENFLEGEEAEDEFSLMMQQRAAHTQREEDLETELGDITSQGKGAYCNAV